MKGPAACASTDAVQSRNGDPTTLKRNPPTTPTYVSFSYLCRVSVVSVRRRKSSRQTRAVLSALRNQPGWSYGYDISRMTGLKSGTLYPMLARLAERGLLEAAWEKEPPPGRPPRHLYRLSPAGGEVAATVSAESPTRPGTAWAVPLPGQV